MGAKRRTKTGGVVFGQLSEAGKAGGAVCRWLGEASEVGKAGGRRARPSDRGISSAKRFADGYAHQGARAVFWEMREPLNAKRLECG